MKYTIPEAFSGTETTSGLIRGGEVLERSQLQEAVFESAWNEPRDMCLTLWTDSIFFLQVSECWVGWNRSQDKERRREEEHSHSGMEMCSFAVKIARRSEVVRGFFFAALRIVQGKSYMI